MKPRGLVVMGLVTAFALGAGSVALAGLAGGFGGSSFSPNKQNTVWTTNTSRTTDQHFQGLAGLNMYLASRGPATITFNGVFSGGPVALRMVNVRGHVLKPGAVIFDPAGHRRGFSFTFVADHGPRDCTPYTPEWRSVSGGPVRLHGADIVGTYHRDAGNTKRCDATTG
jgi:hypothetical protein